MQDILPTVLFVLCGSKTII